MTPRPSDDTGQTSVFIVGVTVVLLLLSLTIAAITSVTLHHRKLLSLADSAAQSAATAFILDDPKVLSLTITQSTATAQVNRHLQAVDAVQRFPNLQVQQVHVHGNSTVTVQLSSTAELPIVNWLLPAGVMVEARGTARTQLSQ
ncbi:MAG TPA: pilus assembly protein TadG-related protein [Enteractinococcus sp.]